MLNVDSEYAGTNQSGLCIVKEILLQKGFGVMDEP
jgi:hypothetical protein